MTTQSVSNSPLSSYPVLVDKTAGPAQAQMQVVRLDIGDGTAESRLSETNPLPVAITSGGGGDATAANQVLEIAELTTLNANTSTAANQTLEIAELTALNAAAVTSQATLDVLVTQSELMADLVSTMKLIRKTLEPLATQDSLQRQRIVVESLSGVAANTILGAANLNGVNTITQGSAAPSVGSYTFQPVWEGPVDQRYRIADAARTMAYVQRQNLSFS